MLNYRRWIMVGLVVCAMALAIMPLQANSQTTGSGVISPVPATIVSRYNLDTRWYNKYIDAWGLPVLGSRYLSDATLLEARSQLGTLLWTYPSWPVPELNRRNVRVVLVARSERMSSIPEVYQRYGTSLDSRFWAGFGATPSLPISAATEANLMDNYGNENVFVHEFGHSLGDMSLRYVDPNFSSELNNAWNNARARGLWNNTYAGSNISEYWAEGMQTYFSVNREGPVGGDGVHNNINTRSELYNYDRPLYYLLNRIYRGKTLP